MKRPTSKPRQIEKTKTMGMTINERTTTTKEHENPTNPSRSATIEIERDIDTYVDAPTTNRNNSNTSKNNRCSKDDHCGQERN